MSLLAAHPVPPRPPAGPSQVGQGADPAFQRSSSTPALILKRQAVPPGTSPPRAPPVLLYIGPGPHLLCHSSPRVGGNDRTPPPQVPARICGPLGVTHCPHSCRTPSAPSGGRKRAGCPLCQATPPPLRALQWILRQRSCYVESWAPTAPLPPHVRSAFLGQPGAGPALLPPAPLPPAP